MTQTVTITHHKAKPEYKWEVVVPEGPTVLLAGDKLHAALAALGLKDGSEAEGQIEALPNGGSQSINAEFGEGALKELIQLGVKTV